MGLYIGFGILWFIGATSLNFLRVATISNIVFMTGLAFGRITSIFLDGYPSVIPILGMFGEIGLAVWGWRNLKMFEEKKIPSSNDT
jgi:hypothetical protein